MSIYVDSDWRNLSCPGHTSSDSTGNHGGLPYNATPTFDDCFASLQNFLEIEQLGESTIDRSWQNS